VYSAAWMPAVTSTYGPASRPAIPIYGHRYFARPSSPLKVNDPVARAPAAGIGIGPMFTRQRVRL